MNFWSSLWPVSSFCNSKLLRSFTFLSAEPRPLPLVFAAVVFFSKTTARYLTLGVIVFADYYWPFFNC